MLASWGGGGATVRVFGASDEVLGAVESGVDFEKRIAAIYQQCRTTEQIQFEFDELQRDLETQISTGQRDAREKLLDNFDQEVVEKVRVDSSAMLSRFNDQLWRLTRHVLAGHASFADDAFGFTLHTNPFLGETINPGPHRMSKGVEDANTYRLGRALAQRVLARARELAPEPADVAFDYAGSGKHIAILEPLRGRSGWLACARVTMSSSASARRARSKRGARRPGGHTMRPAATLIGRRTSCSMSSAGGWNSGSSRRRCSRCGGG